MVFGKYLPSATCVAGGMRSRERVCMARGHAWQRRHAWQGGCMARGPCVEGRCVAGGGAWQEETTTAADSMHPTGMHPCMKIIAQVPTKFDS